jgi:uracil-DNA glycosylase
MKGFFTKKDYFAPRTKEKIEEVKDPCESCGLYKGCKHPKMKYTGKGQKEILIIAEAPGKTEDEKGIQLIGEAGQILRNALKDIGYDLDHDFWKTNSVICRPPDNRKPTRKELKLCYHNIEETINELKPKFIWLMGSSAITSFYSHRFSDLSVNTWRRRLIPDFDRDCFVIPMFHPSYILRNQDEKLNLIFQRDIKWALFCLNKKMPPLMDLTVNILNEQQEIEDFLEDILEDKKSIVFDYETSALNSHLPDPKIWSIGVNGFSFGLDHPDIKYDISNIEKLWGKILRNKDIPKINQNIKFEYLWGLARFGVETKGWIHDTLVTQHILEYRSTSIGLKFQSFVRWGVPDYEKEMKKYIIAGQSQNKLNAMPLENLCRYNAIDTLVTERLYKEQVMELAKDEDLTKANNLFLKGTLAFCDIESQGICINESWYNTRDKELQKLIDKIELDLMEGKEGKLFKNATGRDLNIKSVKDLKILFFDILKIKSDKKTSSGGMSVDVEALSNIHIPFIDDLLRYRRLKKIKDTYLAQFIREGVNGKIYPNFHLHTVDTYRSSSSNPNFQNIPVRDEEAKKETRSGIIPSKGNKLLEIDYSAMEVRICACYTKDPTLIKYINDPTSDMHYDIGREVWIASDKEMTKMMRFHTKNGFVFPEIYGSYYVSCAQNLWEEAKSLTTGTDTPLLTHLKRKNISSLDDFIEHIKKIENGFWRRFPLIKKWKEENETTYKKRGHIQFLFGHRRSGLLSRNQLSNYPIQGAAFHCLLWSLIRLNNIRVKENWKTKIIGQIHDSILFDLYPSEQERVVKMANWVMTKAIRKEFPFLCVPLEVEAEVTKVNESWYNKEKLN